MFFNTLGINAFSLKSLHVLDICACCRIVDHTFIQRDFAWRNAWALQLHQQFCYEKPEGKTWYTQQSTLNHDKLGLAMVRWVRVL